MAPSAKLPLGTLIALGGGDDDPVLALVNELLPTPDTPVEVVSTAAYRHPVKTGNAYVAALRELGCTNVHHLRVDASYPGDRAATLRRLEKAGAVFFTGGDQECITEHWTNTPALQLLCERYQTDPNFIIAGTSAGAAAMPSRMIVAGFGARSLTKGGMHTANGLSLIQHLIIDQHFAERGRFGRLAHAVLQHPASIGLGLGQETGVIIRGGHDTEVFGDGVVIVVDGAHLTGDNLGRIGRGEPVAGQNLRVHLLVAGQHYDLRTRRVAVETPENAL
ncbi:cyanophycinase [Hymenobacter busanensis]|uniref:Cyanophycinase n=1 Tax=Hymenobacter busanensis TaxID=2607656 RepID=A0A7L5A2B2_9BACT|nr:cyanophycinase [Hymenobacter busanensis]KAA9331418.1 cyanophycinase [Hymenobacter busanensis]QHJ08572.1 cyanophycinase [Hymenobacter busanensis]